MTLPKKIIVEKGIPFMDFREASKRKYPFDTMKVNESFEAGEYSRNKMQSIHGSIAFFLKQAGNSKKKFRCAKTLDKKIRVWRIK